MSFEIVSIPPQEWAQYAIFPNISLESSKPTQLHILNKLGEIYQQKQPTLEPNEKYYSRPTILLISPDALYVGLSWIDLGDIDWDDNCGPMFDKFLESLTAQDKAGSLSPFKFLKVPAPAIESHWIHCEKVNLKGTGITASKLFKYDEDDPFRDSTNFNLSSPFALGSPLAFPDMSRQGSIDSEEGRSSRSSRISLKPLSPALDYAFSEDHCSDDQQREYSLKLQVDQNLPVLFDTQSLSTLQRRFEQMSVATPEGDGTCNVQVRQQVFDLATLAEAEVDFSTTISNSPTSLNLDLTGTIGTLGMGRLSLTDESVFGDLLLDVAGGGIGVDVGENQQTSLTIIPVPLCSQRLYGTRTVTQRQLYLANALNSMLAKMGHPEEPLKVKKGLGASYSAPYSLVYQYFHLHSAEYEATILSSEQEDGNGDRDQDEWKAILEDGDGQRQLKTFAEEEEEENDQNVQNDENDEESEDEVIQSRHLSNEEALAAVENGVGNGENLTEEQREKLLKYDQILLVPDQYKYMLEKQDVEQNEIGGEVQ